MSPKLTKAERQRVADVKSGISMAVGYLSGVISPERARECLENLGANFDVDPRLFLPAPIDQKREPQP
jgi:hypothetical protein